MTGIRTTTLGVAVLGIGLSLGACANPAAKSAAPPAPTVAALAAQITASAPAAPAVQAVPVAQVAPVQVAPASTPPAPPVETTAGATPPPASASPGASTPTSGSAPHFSTPADAMRYLVTAYNNHDIAAEMHVTTPDARTQLEAERQWVNTFSFDSCDVDGSQGDYICTFDMASMVATASAETAMGEITVIVAPASRPGWYMYASEGCGD